MLCVLSGLAADTQATKSYAARHTKIGSHLYWPRFLALERAGTINVALALSGYIRLTTVLWPESGRNQLWIGSSPGVR